jgi:hypothetical protein
MRVCLKNFSIRETDRKARSGELVPESFHEEQTVQRPFHCDSLPLLSGSDFNCTQKLINCPLRRVLQGRVPYRLCFSTTTLILLSVPRGVKRNRVGPISDVFIAVQDRLGSRSYKRNAMGIASGFKERRKILSWLP